MTFNSFGAQKSVCNNEVVIRRSSTVLQNPSEKGKNSKAPVSQLVNAEVNSGKV